MADTWYKDGAWYHEVCKLAMSLFFTAAAESMPESGKMVQCDGCYQGSDYKCASIKAIKMTHGFVPACKLIIKTTKTLA